MPLSMTVFTTLPKAAIAEAAGLFSYGRMVGTSIGISVISTIVSQETQINWNRLAGHIFSGNPNLRYWLNMKHAHLADPLTIHQLTGEVSRQANMIAFVDCYYSVALAFLALIPLVFLLRKTSTIKSAKPGGMH